MDKEMQSTVAKYYGTLISDFKTNEKKIMGELDEIVKLSGGKKNAKASDMKGAVEGTE